MYKKILAIILAVSCINTYSEENQNSHSHSEKITITQMQAAQKALESMDNRWTPSQMAGISTAIGILAAVYVSNCGQINPDVQRAVLNICGGAVASGSALIIFAPNESGNHQERMKLINIIDRAQK